MSNQQSANELVELTDKSSLRDEQNNVPASSERSETVLLYDAKCELCKGLALQVRSFARKPIELVALSDPEADQILSGYYPGGWSYDFYVVDDGTCRKGARAFPKLARIVGIRRFASLVGDYAKYKRHSENCGQSSNDDPKPKVDHANPESATGVSRRSFTSMMGAGAFSLAAPLSNLSSKNKGLFTNNPPKGLSVHVAEVTPDTNGNLDVSIQRRPDLVLSDEPDTHVSDGDRRINNTSIYTQKESTLSEGILNSGTSFKFRKAVNEVTFKNPTPETRAMMRAQGGDDRGVQITMYDLEGDFQRFTTSIHAGRGPVIPDTGDPTEMTTMSGTIEHDTPQPVIDFVWVNADDLALSTHLEAYALGVESLIQFYADRGNTDLATVYADITDRLHDLHENIDANVDEPEPVPASNHIAISGLSNFQQFAKPPEDSQPIVQNGIQCKWGCAIDILCCGIGPGCGVCVGAGIGCSVGGCCVIGGSCGYYCCYNW